MNRSFGLIALAFVVVVSGVVAARHARPHATVIPQRAEHQEVLALFKEWRTFQRPPAVADVPQYTAAAMEAQGRGLPDIRHRLEAIDRNGWSAADQIDWYLVRAEMNGLDFDLRVRKPWATNPAFYVMLYPSRSDQPAREGPVIEGAIELWTYPFPLTAERAADLDRAIRTIPPLLEQARTNLSGNGKDLWTYGAKRLKQQSVDLAALAAKVSGTSEELRRDVDRAKTATDAFAAWVEAQAASKTGPSGVGIDNYNWYLENVQLVPYTWQDEVTIMERELERAHALLAMEERRNAQLPGVQPIAISEEYERRFRAAVSEYLAFLDDHALLPKRDYFGPALLARMGRFRPGPREFFNEVSYRDPEIMLTHDYHWFDLARLEHEPNANPIRQGPLLYNIFNTRTEGHATGWEELMMQAGMLDARPRSRELVYVLLAERAARALGDLRMHANQSTLEQAAQFASANTPRGWLSLDRETVREEQFLYLQQPAYGTSYIIGKIQFEALLARAASRQDFDMRRLMENFHAAGLIPIPLIQWELTNAQPAGMAAVLAR